MKKLGRRVVKISTFRGFTVSFDYGCASWKIVKNGGHTLVGLGFFKEAIVFSSYFFDVQVTEHTVHPLLQSFDIKGSRYKIICAVVKSFVLGFYIVIGGNHYYGNIFEILIHIHIHEHPISVFYRHNYIQKNGVDFPDIGSHYF